MPSEPIPTADDMVEEARIEAAKTASECDFWGAVDRGDTECVAEILALIWNRGKHAGINYVMEQL